MKLTTKEREFLEHLLFEELYMKGDDLRRYERRLRIDQDIIKELKSDIKIVNSIKAKFLKAKIIKEDLC
tara:strand:+ start:200 stop:406 length:207 start_codon:yes stop_codon:yes gene_type:complete